MKALDTLRLYFVFLGRFFHVTEIIKDFGTTSFAHDVIFAVLITVFGIVLIKILQYIVKRYRNVFAFIEVFHF